MFKDVCLSTESLSRTAAALTSSWQPLVRARTTKMEMQLVQALTTPGLVGAKRKKALQRLQQQYLTELGQWERPADPAEHVWPLLWAEVRAALQ